MHILREEVENTTDTTGGIGSVNGSKYKVTCFRSVDRSREGFHVTHFAHQHDVRVLTHGVFHCDFEVFHIDADFALIDQTLILCVNEFDRVFNRQNVLAVMIVHPVQHGSNGS